MGIYINSEYSHNSGNDSEVTHPDLYPYIDLLTRDITPHHIKYYNTDMVIDSGAVNGIIGIGALLFIKTLEDKKMLKIGRISGSSVGSIIGLWYIYGCSSDIIKSMSQMFEYYKKYNNFYIYKHMVKSVVSSYIRNNDMSAVNNRLFINYYDMSTCKNVIVSTYKSRKHLIRCILRSSHVPFITSNKFKYNDRYIDGIHPYIFPDTRCLFIQLMFFSSPIEVFRVKDEGTIYPRLFRGIDGAYIFFFHKTGHLCKYITVKNEWINIQFFLRKYYILSLIIMIDLFIRCINVIPPCIKDTIIYNRIKYICTLPKHIIYKLIF